MKKIKTEIKNKILSVIGNMSDLFITVFSKSIDLGFDSYELGQKIFYDTKAKNFWSSGNLYKLKNEIKINLFESLFEADIKVPELFQTCDLKVIKEKGALKQFLEKNYSKKIFLSRNDYFLILEKQYFSFGNCVLQILLKDKVYILVLNKDQSKKPWKYFEYENS